ncbi:hypothetical protein [Pseudomarimonas salicorniae]|uniref:Uncharacterized protein n=1 Tax=Pseudomarimonas salicorniae TaxID=2933270 RepID=A0ABT0GCR2_9GAMM|nr:hypothetical protein [Lysobacter sp. CAU 1642]MCK7592327.1 hypothetical protein [Lysobacter sp. CAU 1642]
MEWQGVFEPIEKPSFGNPTRVAEMLREMWPCLLFSWSRTGVEELARIDAQGFNPPEEFRQIVAARPSFLCGSGVSEGIELSFNVGSGETADCIWATLGGEDSDVLGVIAKIEKALGARSMSPEPLDVREYGDTSKPVKGATLYRSGSSG